MKLLYPLFKKIAFSFDPEVIHEYSIRVLSDYPLLSELFDQKVSASENDKYEVSLNGPSWSFPVGLAAGLDKNALALDFFSRLYFASIAFTAFLLRKRKQFQGLNKRKSNRFVA